MSFPYFSISADVDKSVKYAENANGATRIHSLGNNHDFMLHWDDHDAWLYINSIDNYIKLGPVGNDLSKKQDVNQYKTIEIHVPFEWQNHGSTTEQTWGDTKTVNASENGLPAGWKMIGLCGYEPVRTSGTQGDIQILAAKINVSDQTVTASCAGNSTGGGTGYANVLVTCAPVS